MSDLTAGIAVFILLAYLGFMALYLVGGDREQLRLQVRLFFWAFAARFLLSLVIYQLGLVSITGDEDASGWTGGVGLSHQWLTHQVGLLQLPSVLLGAFKEHDLGYRYLLGALFYLSDLPYRLPAAALNGFFGALTVVFVWRSARCLFSPWVADRAGWWACFFPSMMIWSAQTVKEPIVILLESAALYACLRLRQLGPSPRHLAICVTTIVLLLPFRFYAAYLVGGAVLFSLLVRGLASGRSTMATVGLAALLIPLVFGTGLLAVHTSEFEKFDLNRVQSFRHGVSTGGEKNGSGSGVQTEDVRSTHGLVIGTAVGAVHLMLAPLPWELGGASPRMLLTLPELLVWWWLFFAGVVPGLRHLIRHRLMDVSPMLLLCLTFGMLYSLMFGNVGLAFRQRAQLLPWLLIFAAVGLEQRGLRHLALAAGRNDGRGQRRAGAALAERPSSPSSSACSLPPARPR